MKRTRKSGQGGDENVCGSEGYVIARGVGGFRRACPESMGLVVALYVGKKAFGYQAFMYLHAVPGFHRHNRRNPHPSVPYPTG